MGSSGQQGMPTTGISGTPAMAGPMASTPIGPSYAPPTGTQPSPMTGGGVAPGLNTAYQANTNIAGGANLNPATNPALQSYYQAAASPLIQQYQQATSPDILGNAVQSGNLFSSAPQQQQQNAQTALAQGLGNLGANIYEPAYQSALGQQSQAIAEQPALAQGQYIPSQELAGTGSQQQQLQQNILSYPMSLLSGLAGMVGPGTGSSGSTISVGTQPGSMK
jgi:hypothetical protein